LGFETVNTTQANLLAVQDVRIQQKVNRAHRLAFRERMPGQVEHCQRLVMERLQHSLVKQPQEDPSDPITWRVNAHDVAELSRALWLLSQVLTSAQLEPSHDRSPGPDASSPEMGV
jgi:hypothetical protein